MYRLLILMAAVFISNVAMSDIINNSLQPIENLILRADLISTIDNKIKQGNSALYVAGEAGVGKTQLVRKYIEGRKEEYDVIWWINYNNDIAFQIKELKKELQRQICKNECAISVEEDNLFRGIKRFIKDNKLKILFVIDNTPNANEVAYIKEGVDGVKSARIIFISRKESNKKTDISVSGFSKKEALKYVENSLLPDRLGQENVVKSIIKDGKGIPLALERLVYLFNTMTNLEVEAYNKIKDKSQIGELLDTNDKLALEDPSYDRNLYSIYKQNFIKMKNESKDAYNLLKYISYLSESIDEKTLNEIWNAQKGEDTQPRYYKAVNYLTKSFVLKGYKKIREKDNLLTYEIHPLLKEILYNEVTNEGNNSKNIDFLLKVYAKCLPKNFTKLSEYAAKQQIVLTNLENLIDISNKNKLINKTSLQLKIRLLRIYIDNFLYDRAVHLIEQINVDIDKLGIINDKGTIQHQVMLYLLEGRLWNYKYANYTKGIRSLKKAENIMDRKKIATEESIKFLVLCHLADVMYHSGNIIESNRYLQKLENELSEYLSNNENLEYYNMVRAKLLFDKGNNVDALKEAEKGLSIKITRLGNKKNLLLPYVILKSEILINMNKNAEAEKYLDLYYEECFKEGHGNSKLLESRVLRVRGLAKLRLGYTKKAEKDIKYSIQLLEANNNLQQKNKELNPYLADAYVVRADILFEESYYEDALRFYRMAEDIYLLRYNHVIQIKKLSDLFEKIMNTSLKLGDEALANRYLYMHIENFGKESNGSKRMMEALLK